MSKKADKIELLPVCNFNETSTGGTQSVVIHLFIKLAILEWANTEKTKLRLGPWALGRSLHLFGDQLTISHTESMIPNIMRALGDVKTVSTARAVLQALGLVFRILGCLHIKMHILDAIFRLCYGAFLQPF